MKRFAAVGMTLALAIAAGPASAKNTGTEDGGPPFLSGSDNGVLVIHCKAIGGHGTVVLNGKVGKVSGNGDCF